jgi:hypothetical protein
LLQRGDLGCEGDVLCPDGWTYTCTGGRNLVSCCPTDHTNICGCIPPAGQILQDDFETSKEDWSVAYSPMIMSGGRDPQPIPECNKNDFEWDEIELKSGAHSYYLKAGKNINIFAGGIVGARDCKTFITKTFEVDTPAGKTLSWWYKSEQGTNGKRFFNVYVNGNSVWSAQVDQVDEWQQESIVLGGGVTSPVTVKLEVFYDGAWSASTSGWFDKLEITEGGQEEFELPEIDCRQSACGKGMDCIEENNAWVCAENYEIYFCGGGAGSRRWDTDADCQARDGQDCEAVYFGACNAPNCDTYCTNTAGFVRGVTSGTRTGRTGDRYQCKCTDDQVFRGGNLG